MVCLTKAQFVRTKLGWDKRFTMPNSGTDGDRGEVIQREAVETVD